jgi:hypothetical protein
MAAVIAGKLCIKLLLVPKFLQVKNPNFISVLSLDVMVKP